MQEPLKYFHVNWIDGMKINKNHFIAMENAFSDQVKDAIGYRITKNNFGLLPPLYGNNSSVKIVLNVDNQNSIRLKVFECRAITPSGARIELFENSPDIYNFNYTYPETAYELDATKEVILYVALSVDPFIRIPVGNADPSEEPPRYPYTLPEIKVHIIPENQLTKKELGPNFLTIGRIIKVDGKPEIDKEYIPPCTSVQAHNQLARLHAEFDRFLGQLELDVIKILKKIHEKEQSNLLALVVAQLTEYLMFFLSTNILDFRLKVADQTPLAMFETIARCARLIKNSIDSNSTKAKEELLNYFAEWCSLSQGEIDEMLINTVNFQYEHTRIHETVVIMTKFAEVISTLFSKLSNLEYIGKKKETLFVKEEQKVKKSFLVDD